MRERDASARKREKTRARSYSNNIIINRFKAITSCFTLVYSHTTPLSLILYTLEFKIKCSSHGATVYGRGIFLHAHAEMGPLCPRLIQSVLRECGPTASRSEGPHLVAARTHTTHKPTRNDQRSIFTADGSVKVAKAQPPNSSTVASASAARVAPEGSGHCHHDCHTPRIEWASHVRAPRRRYTSTVPTDRSWNQKLHTSGQRSGPEEGLFNSWNHCLQGAQWQILGRTRSRWPDCP